MSRKMPAVMIAAVGSGCGKTTITCALLERLRQRGMKIAAFKCGPDYIDPMFHRQVIGIPSHNLDSFFLDGRQIQQLYTEQSAGSEICIVEGVMGLFDGLGGIREEGSSYQIASILKIPIILVVDAYGMGRSLLPLIAGFLQYDKGRLIQGVLLNRMTESFYHAVAPVIEQQLKIDVVGFLPKNNELVIQGRHLGLQLPGEINDLQEKLACAANLLENTVETGKILEIAQGAGVIENQKRGGVFPEWGKRKHVRIGIARDEAFCFYYEENLKVLEFLGAELEPFSPLHGDKLPESLDGLILGGGYPEHYAKELAENESMRMDVRQAIEGGMPSLAECGGFMYLHRTLRDIDGKAYPMCGVIRGECFYAGKPVRFGYVELTEKRPAFLEAGKTIKGHEFHYYDSSCNGRDCNAKKPVGDKEWECIHSGKNHFWGFAHLYYPSDIGFIAHFMEEAGSFGGRGEKL